MKVKNNFKNEQVVVACWTDKKDRGIESQLIRHQKEEAVNNMEGASWLYLEFQNLDQVQPINKICITASNPNRKIPGMKIIIDNPRKRDKLRLAVGINSPKGGPYIADPEDNIDVEEDDPGG